MGNWNPIAEAAFRFSNVPRKRVCLQEVAEAEAGAVEVVAEAGAEAEADDAHLSAFLKMHVILHLIPVPCALHSSFNGW